jgi:hypothetical protein
VCDTLVALAGASATGHTLFAKNSDRPPSEAQAIELLDARIDEGPTQCTHIEVEPFGGPTHACVISRPLWCWGAEHGVNEAGVAIGNEAIYTTLDPRSAPAALTGMDLVRLGLERAGSASDAVEVITDLLERYGQGGTGHDPANGVKAYWSSFLVADSLRAFVIETSGRTWAVDEVEDVRAISNRTTIPAFDAEHRHPRQPVERLVDPRWHASQAVLAHQPVGVGALMQHLRSHDSCGESGWSVCMHVDGVEVTTASMVAELHADGPSTAWMLLGSPCETEYTRITI